MDKYIKEVLFTKEQIEEKCKELGKWVDSEYKDSNELVLVGVLSGVVPFFAELMKNITIMHEIDFLKISSYEGTESNGMPTMTRDLNRSIDGKDVLIVEDIVDTGRTLKALKSVLAKRNANSVKVLSLLDKPEGRVVEFEADKIGWTVPNHFVVGFGFDYNEKLRNLPYIGIFNQDYLDKI